MTDTELPLVWYATDRPDDALMLRLAEAPLRYLPKHAGRIHEIVPDPPSP